MTFKIVWAAIFNESEINEPGKQEVQFWVYRRIAYLSVNTDLLLYLVLS